jgi:uracil-DNA glycosylase
MRPNPPAPDPLSKEEPDLDALLAEIRACRRCAGQLPYAPRPVLAPKPGARLLIVGQAPGTRVHATGLPWNDPSGDRLRRWLGVDRAQFYGDPAIGIMPMGFCYPGKGRSGDLPPRRECAPAWHGRVRRFMPDLSLILLVGAYAQRHYLGAGGSLTDVVRSWRSTPSPFFPLPHPSPRNIGWFLKNPWFEAEVLPALRERVAGLLAKATA